MATHDYVLANAAGAAFRADLNDALEAIVSQNSNATQPTTTYAYMPWFDTTNGILKFRNATNTGWVIDDLNSARGSVTMHATTMDLWAEPKIIDGTGSSVTITDIADAPQAGAVRILYPVAGTVITNGATFNVDGNDNYTTSAGHALIFEAVTTSTFKVHIVKSDGTSIVKAAGVLGTAVATTSGTAIDFTGIPSWVKRIVVSINGVSTNGTSFVQVQIGAGSITSSGYKGAASLLTDVGNASYVQSTSSFVFGTFDVNGGTLSGVMTLVRLSGNVWNATGTSFRYSGTNVVHSISGVLSLGGTLDRVRLTTFNGTDTFDAGSVNIIYE